MVVALLRDGVVSACEAVCYETRAHPGRLKKSTWLRSRCAAAASHFVARPSLRLRSGQALPCSITGRMPVPRSRNSFQELSPRRRRQAPEGHKSLAHSVSCGSAGTGERKPVERAKEAAPLSPRWG